MDGGRRCCSPTPPPSVIAFLFAVFVFFSGKANIMSLARADNERDPLYYVNSYRENNNGRQARDRKTNEWMAGMRRIDNRSNSNSSSRRIESNDRRLSL